MPPKRKRADSVAGPSTGAKLLAGLDALNSPSLVSAATSSQPDPATPKSKRARTKKDPDAPVPEKRGAMFKKKCPKNIEERVERVMSQRFFMVERSRNGDELREQFNVLGSTGNVYTVTIAHTPSCTCPDSRKGNHCKHILFVFLKVLQAPMSSSHWYQKALLTSELEEVFANAPLAPNHVSNARIQQIFAQATGKAPKDSGPSSQNDNRKIPTEEDDCPICYESMHKAPEDQLVFCEISCGKPLHKECFGQWRQTQTAKHADVTCVWCRTKWPTAGPTAGSSTAATTSEGYLNIGAAVGVSSVRDESTYYSGVIRGWGGKSRYGKRGGGYRSRRDWD